MSVFNDLASHTSNWDSLTHEQKNHELFLQQKALLDRFLEKGAITQEQHDQSLRDLEALMRES